jgi:hypothetical protein
MSIIPPSGTQNYQLSYTNINFVSKITENGKVVTIFRNQLPQQFEIQSSYTFNLVSTISASYLYSPTSVDIYVSLVPSVIPEYFLLSVTIINNSSAAVTHVSPIQNCSKILIGCLIMVNYMFKNLVKVCQYLIILLLANNS